MANLRKLLGTDITRGNLMASPLREVALDRIYALGTTDPLGACIWRLKWAHDSKAYKRTVALLSLRVRSIAPTFTLRNKLAKTVIAEYLDENCRTCGGRKFIMASESAAKHVCTVCDGTGVRRYSDQWRIRQMGLDREAYRVWERRFAAAHQKLVQADLNAWRDVAAQLGWIQSPGDAEKYVEKSLIRATLPLVDADDEGQNSNYMPELHVSSPPRNVGGAG